MNYVYGGSFNPPTIAHQKIMMWLLEQKQCEKLIILPVGNDYQKPYLANFNHRYNMLKILTKSMKNVKISKIEKKYPYQGTLKSLKRLNKRYQELAFVIGSDQLEAFNQWIDYKELLASYPFIIMQRSDTITQEQIEEMFKTFKHEFYFVPFHVTISATEVRINQDKRKTMITPEIAKYINKNRLYKE